MTDNRLDDGAATGGRGSSRPALDDAALGLLISEVVGDWTAPPQRLGRPAWRDLVAEPRPRGRSGGGWIRRFGGAVTAAVTATVVLALVAVWLTGPRSPGLVGSSPSGSAAPPSAAAPVSSPAETPLPARAAFGAPLPDATLLVGAGSSFRALNLRTGALSAPVADWSSGPSAMWPQPDGTFLCTCLRRTSVVDPAKGTIDAIEVRVLRLAADGTVLSEVSVPGYQVQRDPALAEDFP